MKFLCDRCKTRYSIGDDRVRGKILKIRCKNCANVITVREGMSDEGDVDDAARRGRPTTGSPNPAHTTRADNGSPANSLTNAFAAQMTKPPAALEEEWYVSIDGEQAGPFSLADAQRWVSGKAFDADLHCWSEGFDDWLPVDKVSHFRGLRKKPVPASAPPPMPRAQPAPRDEDPKPLFAATMASLERGGDPKVSLPAMTSVPTTKGPGVASVGGGVGAGVAQIQARANGAVAPAPVATNTIPSVAKGISRTPVGGVQPAPAVQAKSTPATKSGSNPRIGTTPGPGVPTKLSAGAAALAAAFDASEQESGDSLTAVEAPVFDDEIATRAEPIAAKRAVEKEVAPTKPAMAAAAPSVADALADDENLEIGEVSRVVKLADLAKSAPRTSRPAVGRTTGQSPRISANSLPQPSLAPIAQLDANGVPVAPPEPMPGESVMAAPLVASHRRGTIMLLAFAGVMLAGLVGAVIFLGSSGDDSTGGGLGRLSTIDTSRPDEITGKRTTPDPVGTGSGSATPVKTPRRIPCPPYCPGPVTPKPPDEVTDPTLKRLDAAEVEEYAAKQNGGTQRCYMRAQKGVDGILVGDVKKVNVTLSIDKDGAVSEVTLSDHANDSLGKCLTSMIKRWRFRTSPGGTFRFALAFASG